MMYVRDLELRIIKVFSEKLNLETPSVNTDLVEEGILDSLAFVELLACLEQEFMVKVPMDSVDIDNFRSIAKIAGFVVGLNQLLKVA
jgi:methoxymalonate biosynthesis acyl carrier protein